MNQEHIKLVEEDNTIYEIDLDCIKRKEQAEEQRNRQIKKQTEHSQKR